MYHNYKGTVGLIDEISEVEPGIYAPTYRTFNVTGDVISADSKQLDIDVISEYRFDNRISILAPKYVLNNFQQLRWITLNNSKWEVKGVKLVYPRLILTLGGPFENG